MRIKSHMAAQTLEGFVAVGLDRTALLRTVGLEEALVSDPKAYIEWATLASLLDAGFASLDRDAERMRQVGRAIARAPSYVLLQRLARTVFSVNRIYDVATRWGARVDLPHVSLEQETISERRLRFRGSIPEPHAPSLPMQHICEGVLVEVPQLIGLPPATIVRSEVTPRTIDIVIELPPSPSIAARLRRAVKAAFSTTEAIDLLEQQRRELADALAEQQRANAETRELLDRLPELVMIHRDGVILWMNRANVAALGYERVDEVVGRPILELTAPISRDNIRARMSRPIGVAVPESTEVRLLRRDGRVVVVEVSPAQNVVFEGRAARLVAARDVTDRTRLQEQLLIADRMASIGMLAAGVAHEVNNPLGYVLNNIEIARAQLANMGEPASETKGVLGVALEGVDRIRKIVRDLLALSRVHDDAIGPVDVLDVVQSTVMLAESEIAKRAVLSFEHEPTAPAAGTVARLGQVLLNLIANALESMSSNAKEENRLRVSIKPSSDGGVAIEVADNGVGIPEEHAARIFDPFFTTKAPGSGTGLGLAIGQRLVTEMGGHLSFESTPGRGSTFRVTLAPWLPV